MQTSQENDSTNNHKFRECDLCSDDDDKILVSVSPRRFSLPPPSEKQAKVEIRNYNPYTIYFKADTSNKNAFRAEPNMGRIPPNNKAYVVVQFFDPVTPIRRHEEVVVVTSIRPFEQYAQYGCSVCPYCCESFEVSKHHQQVKYVCSPQQFVEEGQCQSRSGEKTALNEDSTKFKADSKGVFTKESSSREMKYLNHQVKYVCSPQQFVEAGQCQSCSGEKTALNEDSTKFKGDSKGVFTEESSSREMKYLPPPDKNQAAKEEVSCTTKQIPVILPWSTSSVDTAELRNRDVCIRNSVLGNNGGQELEEICLHAFVHRPSAQGCGCNRCFDLSSGDKLVEKNIKEAIQDTGHLERRLSDPIPSTKARLDNYDISYKKEIRRSKDIVKLEQKYLEEARNSKDKVKAPAHILARVIKATEAPASSDTELSEMSGKNDRAFKKNKIISEDDFKRKLEKSKFRKHQIRLEEESKSTNTTEVTADSEQLKEEKEVTTTPKKRKKWNILQEKCDTILNLSQTNFYLLLVLIVLVVVVAIFCFSLGQTASCTNFVQPQDYYLPCFFQHFS